MANIRVRPDWYLPEREATPEGVYLNRRAWLKAMGFSGASLLLGSRGFGKEKPTTQPAERYPAKRNAAFKLDRELTDEKVAASYNNFYEFTTDKARVAELAQALTIEPWTVEVAGEVKKPGKYDIERLIADMPFEERLYRFRCVEAWAMAVPWTGFPLIALIKKLEPLGHAKYIAFETFFRPEEAPGQRREEMIPWPYVEGLSMAEAMHDLTIMATGIYGHAMPKQHGAPLRLVVPWKYGFKSIKSIVKISFVREQTPTTWNRYAPHEYTFEANVEPEVPHPRWSQKVERMIGTTERRYTLPFNGYAEQVAALYKKS